MFIKKELLALQEPQKEEGLEEQMSASLHPYHGTKLLRVWIRVQGWREKKEMMVYVLGERYTTYIISEKRWSGASTEYLAGHYALGRIHEREEDRELIRQYLGSRAGGLTGLARWQQDHLDAALREKNHKKLEDTRALMEQIGPRPEGVDAWVDKVVLGEGYLYYKRRGRKIHAWCTACETQVELQEAAHNAQGVCPHCGKPATLKAEGKCRRMVVQGRMAYAQPVREGALLRLYEVHKRYMEHYREPEIVGWEQARYLLTGDGKIREYREIYSSRLGKYQWKPTKEVEYMGEAMLYPDGLAEILTGGPWQYSGAAEFAAAGGKADLGELFACLLRYRSLEHVIKQGYVTLAKEVVDRAERFGPLPLDMTSGYSRMREIFRLPKSWWMDIPKAQLTVQVVHQLQTIRDMGTQELRAGAEEAEVLEKSGHLMPRVWKQLDGQGFAIGKVLRYLAQQKARVTEYTDYLRMGQQLGYQWSRREVLWPSNLKEAHDRAMVRVEIQRNESINRKIQEEADRLQWMEWRRNGLLIRPVRTVEELARESAELHHCVRTYVSRVAQGQTHIFFVRKEREPEKPWYTLEWNGGRVVQCRTENNHSYETSRQVKKFVEMWTEHVRRMQQQTA